MLSELDGDRRLERAVAQPRCDRSDDLALLDALCAAKRRLGVVSGERTAAAAAVANH